MKSIIIDERIRDIEFNYLKQFFNVIKLPISKDVYEEISGHSDIFYCKLHLKDSCRQNSDKLYVVECAPNAIIKEDGFIVGNNIVKNSYPYDVPYNVCQIGDRVIGSKYSDSSINVDIFVKQGYTRCSIAVTSDNSCITTDKGIARELIRNGIDALYIEEKNIKLLKNSVLIDKDYDNNYSEKNGFIGGATLVFDDKFVLFGDSNNLSNKDEVLKHLEKYNLKLVEFKNLPIIDYGSGVIF